MAIGYSTSNAAGFAFGQTFRPGSSSDATNFWNTLPPVPVGTFAIGSDGTQWVYVKFGTGGATLQGYVCVYDEDYLAVMMSNSVGALGDKVGIYPATVAALANDYGWLQVYGTCDQIQVLASCAANVLITSTTTAGALDDAAGTGTKTISNMWLTTARAASQGNAPGTLNFPVVGATN